MAVTVTIDVEESPASFREQGGKGTEFSRTCLIQGLSAGSSTPFTARLAEAQTAMDTNFAYGATTSADANLRVIGREFKQIPGKPTAMYCTVTYGESKDLVGPVGRWVPSLSATLNQVQVPIDIQGIPILLAHQFPDDDDNHPGDYIEQGAKVPQQRPMVELTYTGLIQPASILLEKIKYIGRLNSATWNYGPPGKWLCTNFTSEVHDENTTPITWRVEVSFQADGFNWNPLAVFTDPATGQQPPNLVPYIGYRTVVTQYYADFNQLIPSS